VALANSVNTVEIEFIDSAIYLLSDIINLLNYHKKFRYQEIDSLGYELKLKLLELKSVLNKLNSNKRSGNCNKSSNRSSNRTSNLQKFSKFLYNYLFVFKSTIDFYIDINNIFVRAYNLMINDFILEYFNKENTQSIKVYNSTLINEIIEKITK